MRTYLTLLSNKNCKWYLSRSTSPGSHRVRPVRRPFPVGCCFGCFFPAGLYHPVPLVRYSQLSFDFPVEELAVDKSVDSSGLGTGAGGTELMVESTVSVAGSLSED